jgi:hypothetical protein
VTGMAEKYRDAAKEVWLRLAYRAMAENKNDL